MGQTGVVVVGQGVGDPVDRVAGHVQVVAAAAALAAASRSGPLVHQRRRHGAPARRDVGAAWPA